MKLFTKYFLKVAVCFYVKRKENNIVELIPRGWGQRCRPSDVSFKGSLDTVSTIPNIFMAVLRSTNRTSRYVSQ